jgi:predicted transglutaminase-like cysteine proteinase
MRRSAVRIASKRICNGKETDRADVSTRFGGAASSCADARQNIRKVADLCVSCIRNGMPDFFTGAGGLCIVAASALTGCASSRADVISDINWQVNHDHPYRYYTKRISEARYLQPGEPGNCTDIAFTKQVELKKRGIASWMMACRLNPDYA